MTEAIDPFSEYVPPDKMAAFAAFEAAKEKKEILDTGIVLARRFGFPVVVAAVAGSPAAAARSEKRRRHREDRRRAHAEHGALGARVQALGQGGQSRSSRGRARRQAAPSHARHRATQLDSRRAVDPAHRRRNGHQDSLVRPGHGGGRQEDPQAARPDASAHPRRAQQRDRVVRRGGARRRPLRDGRARSASSRAAGSRRRCFGPSPGERVHESRLVVLVDSGTAGAAELFASALREATVRTPARSSPATNGKKDDRRTTDFDPGPRDGEGRREAAAVRLVGEPTVGMGFTAQVVKLASGGSLRLSVGKIHTLAGKALCPKGLQPDDRVYHGAPDEATGSVIRSSSGGSRSSAESARRQSGRVTAGRPQEENPAGAPERPPRLSRPSRSARRRRGRCAAAAAEVARPRPAARAAKSRRPARRRRARRRGPPGPLPSDFESVGARRAGRRRRGRPRRCRLRRARSRDARAAGTRRSRSR